VGEVCCLRVCSLRRLVVRRVRELRQLDYGRPLLFYLHTVITALLTRLPSMYYGAWQRGTLRVCCCAPAMQQSIDIILLTAGPIAANPPQTDRQTDARQFHRYCVCNVSNSALQQTISRAAVRNKKLSHRRVTARCVLSVVILCPRYRSCLPQASHLAGFGIVTSVTPFG